MKGFWGINERCDYWWRSELDGGSGRMFDGGEKGKAQTAGGSRSRLLERSRRVAGDADLAATDVAVGSQNVDEGPGRVSFRTVTSLSEKITCSFSASGIRKLPPPLRASAGPPTKGRRPRVGVYRRSKPHSEKLTKDYFCRLEAELPSSSSKRKNGMRWSAKLQFSLGRRGIAPARADGNGGRNGPTDARCVQDRSQDVETSRL